MDSSIFLFEIKKISSFNGYIKDMKGVDVVFLQIEQTTLDPALYWEQS